MLRGLRSTHSLVVGVACEFLIASNSWLRFRESAEFRQLLETVAAGGMGSHFVRVRNPNLSAIAEASERGSSFVGSASRLPPRSEAVSRHAGLSLS